MALQEKVCLVEATFCEISKNSRNSKQIESQFRKILRTLVVGSARLVLVGRRRRHAVPVARNAHCGAAAPPPRRGARPCSGPKRQPTQSQAGSRAASVRPARPPPLAGHIAEAGRQTRTEVGRSERIFGWPPPPPPPRASG